MRPAYPELMESRAARRPRGEGRRAPLRHHLPRGREGIQRRTVETRVPGGPGRAFVRLYDTYGLALDEQEEMARERGFTIDREASKPRWTASASVRAPVGRAQKRAPSLRHIGNCCEKGRTRFLGYDDLDAAVEGGRPAGQSADRRQHRAATPKPNWFSTRPRSTPRPAARSAIAVHCLTADTGEQVAAVVDTLPGGPGLDGARIRTHRAICTSVTNCAPKWPRPERARHTAQPHRDASTARCAAPGSRYAREAGRQRGGAAPAAFRLHAITPRWIPPRSTEMERLVNEKMLRNTQVATEVMPIDQAISTGAMALFGEKYGEEVRVVSIPDFSKELCGGTHVRAPAISASSRLFRRAASRPVCAVSKRSPAKRGAPVPAIDRSAPSNVRACYACPSPNWSNRSNGCSPSSGRTSARSSSSRRRLRNRRLGDLESAGAKEKNGAKFLAARVDGSRSPADARPGRLAA